MLFTKTQKKKKLFEILESFNTVRKELSEFITDQDDKVADLTTKVQELQTEQAATMVVREEAASVLANLDKLLNVR